jgi:hypothetical protein
MDVRKGALEIKPKGSNTALERKEFGTEETNYFQKVHSYYQFPTLWCKAV